MNDTYYFRKLQRMDRSFTVYYAGDKMLMQGFDIRYKRLGFSFVYYMYVRVILGSKEKEVGRKE